MRILYLTAHLSDVDVAQRALEKGPNGAVEIEACASVRDASRSLGRAPADGIVIDLTGTHGDTTRWIRELRLLAPDCPIVALVRAGATAPAADALLAGADDTLIKHREFFLHLPGLVAQTNARRHASAQREAETSRLLVVGAAVSALVAGTPLQVTTADDDWWLAPAETTAAVRPSAILLDDTRGATAVVAAIKALRDAQRFEPVVIVTDSIDDEERGAYRRLGVAACVARADVARLPDVLERTSQTARLESELTVLRAREQRLRALIETIPTTVALVSADGTVQAMNLAGLTLIGAREPGQIVGKPFTTLCDANDADGVRAFVTQVCAGSPGLVRFSGKGIDGEARTFEFRSVPLRRERDASSALGVMRVVPVDRVASTAHVPVGSEIEIPLDGRAKTPPPATGNSTLDALREQLETKQQAHDSLQARLAELEAQRAVSDAAWNAVQSQLERTLLLQAAHQTASEDRRGDSVARFEQELNEKDAHLLALAEERDAAAARFDHLDAAHASAQLLLEERAALIAQLQDTLATAESSRGHLEETLAQHLAQLADLDDAREQDDRRLESGLAEVSSLHARLAEATAAREQLERDVADLRTASAAVAVERDADRAHLLAITAELSALRTQSDAHSREQATLADVRQQMARFQTEAAALEQLRHDVDAATNRAERLQQALEEALGTRADLQQRVRETDAAGTRLRVELDQARAALDTTFAERTALKDQLAALQRQIPALETELAHLREQQSVAGRDEVDQLRAQLATLETRVRGIAPLRAELDTWQARCLTSEGERDRIRFDADALKARISTLDADLVAAKAELRAAVDGAQATSATLGMLERERDEARAELDAVRTDLQAAVEAARSANDELAKLQHDRNDAVSELSRERALHADAQAQRLAAETTLADTAARLAGVEQDLTTARESVGAIAEERNTLKQSLADFSSSRQRDTEALDALRAREAKLVGDLSAAHTAADAARDDAAAVRAALDVARRDHDALRDRVSSDEAARQRQQDEEQRLREHVTQAHAQLAEHRHQVAELEAEREHLRESLSRAEAGAQLLAGRHLDERDAVQRTLDELRGAFAEAETRWTVQRAELEQAVATRADAHRRLSDSGVVGLASTTIDGQLLRCNDALARFCGYAQASDLLTQPDGLVLPLPVDWSGFARHLEAVAAPVVVESCVQHPDGRITWLQASATLTRTASNGSTLEWTIVDATDRYLRMRQMKQSRRLDAIRELAVSAGREVVEQLAALSRTHEADDASLRDTARRSIARARDVAQQLVTFAQKQARLPQLLDLNETVAHLRPTLRRLTGEDVTMDVAVAPGTLVVSTDPAETEQWMTSLVVACRDALPAGGTLTVATRALDLATAGSGSERRVTPVAQVSLVAAGLGARPVSVPMSLSDLLSHRGGTLRPAHDAVTNTARVDVYLPLVRPTRAADAPFPLLRTDLVAQTVDPLT